MSKRSTDSLVREAEVPMGAMDTGAARPRLSGRVIGLVAAALVLAFSLGFAVVWNQDTEQLAPRVVIGQEDPRLKYEFEGGAPMAPRVVIGQEDPRLKYEFEGGAPMAPRVVIGQEDPRLKYEFEGGAPVAEPRPDLSTSDNPPG